jgi:hypothetical protein
MGEADFNARELGAASQNFFLQHCSPGKTAQIFQRTLKPSTVMMTVWSTVREVEANGSGNS